MIGHDAGGVGDGRQVFPAGFHLTAARHIRHRTARAHVGQNDDLLLGGQDVGGFRHEVDAAKNDVLRLRMFGGELGEFEAVSPKIGPLDDLVPLVVVAQDQQIFAEAAPRGRDAGVGLFRRQAGDLDRQGLLKHEIVSSGAQSRRGRSAFSGRPAQTGMLSAPANVAVDAHERRGHGTPPGKPFRNDFSSLPYERLRPGVAPTGREALPFRALRLFAPVCSGRPQPLYLRRKT